MEKRIPEDELPFMYRVMAVLGPGGTFLVVAFGGFVLLVLSGKVASWAEQFVSQLFGK